MLRDNIRLSQRKARRKKKINKVFKKAKSSCMISDTGSTIQRCPHDSENPYTMILNALIRDASISPNCRWLIIYLLSNKEGWVINVKQIAQHVKGHIGRECVYKLINEAIEAGYMKREIIKVGNLNQTIKYFVSEIPKFKKSFRHPDFQDAEAQGPENTHIKKEHNLKKEHKKEPPPSSPPHNKTSCSTNPLPKKEKGREGGFVFSEEEQSKVNEMLNNLKDIEEKIDPQKKFYISESLILSLCQQFSFEVVNKSLKDIYANPGGINFFPSLLRKKCLEWYNTLKFKELKNEFNNAARQTS